ncbi:conserved domain protein [Prevotella denticola CRIS 18C-A]|uniref:Conserved domain protein n=1 Tax=Prevotella denticola CRIS 18C-A TaxID=944557 RepID=F0H6R5_9BACT|nr:conserved domain protein [Prevotella denticola CRIS 18C-A]
MCRLDLLVILHLLEGFEDGKNLLSDSRECLLTAEVFNADITQRYLQRRLTVLCLDPCCGKDDK